MTSTGVFAYWQPQYAEQGIATFPVKDKRPCIRGWQKIGLKGSTELASKYADADSFGFQCGMRNGITLIDIDSPDEGMVGEAVKLFGESPVLWRTGSGNFAMPFRHNGERRQIRPIPGLPLDVLGGGYAVAPRSMGAKGRYEFVHGRVADLDRLPPIHAVLDSMRRATAPIPEGRRNDKLFNFALGQAKHVDTLDALFDVVSTRNDSCQVPLPRKEVERLAASAWKYEQDGRNLVGRCKAVLMPHSMIDGLMYEDPDAFLLLVRLQRHHWNREFAIANAMANTMPGGGWPRKRLAAARAKLEDRSLVKIVMPKGRRVPALYRLTQIKSGQI